MADLELLTGVAGSTLLTGLPGSICLTSDVDTPEARAHLVKETPGAALFVGSYTITGLAATAGNHLAILMLHQSQAVTSVVDNTGTAWSVAADEASGTEGRVGIWYRLGVPAGVTSVTVTLAASTAAIGSVVEFNGASINFIGATAGAVGSTANPAAVTVANATSGSIVLSVGGYFSVAAAGKSDVVPNDYQRLGFPGMVISTTYWMGSYKELASAENPAGPDYAATATLTNFGTVTAVFGP